MELLEYKYNLQTMQKRELSSSLTRINGLVLLFYLCFFLFSSSGRLSSGDAGVQLQATMLLVTTGRLGIETPPPDAAGGRILWIKNREGKYYQCHDIGNIVLMYPAVWLSSALSKAPTATKIASPPILAKVAVSLTYAVLCGIACFFMFRLFMIYHGVRQAFLLSLMFVATTIFLPYSKAAYDVLGAACFVCILLYFSARLLSGDKPVVSVLTMGLMAACACSFRYSLTPFLILTVLLILCYSKHSIRKWHWVACTLSFGVGMIPTLVYNYIRMGSVLRPATTAEIYVRSGTADLHGNLLEGLYGLIFSPNKGLLIFSPIFILIFFIPMVWRQSSLQIRQLSIAFGMCAALHILLHAKLRGWGTFGWGPRYLVSILPILFFLASVPFMALWRRYQNLLVALVSLSTALCLAPALVNWHLAISRYPQAANSYARLPYQHMAVWSGLLLGLQGKPLPAQEALRDDPLRSGAARFPDLWTVRLMERSHSGLIAGALISFLLIAPAIWAFRQLTQHSMETCDSS